MIVRTDALKLLAKLRTEEAVITTMSTSREWPAFTNNDALDFPVRPVMGQAPSVGLGVALAQPQRRVWVLNGDGGQLMHLGSIVTIANAGVKNLVLFVFENETYECTGGQPIPLAGRLDFATAALGLGFERTHAFDDLSDLESRLPDVLAEEGPTFVVLKVVPGHAPKTPRPAMVKEVVKFKGSLQGQG